MKYLNHIQESAVKFGFDEQEARNLHKYLSTCSEPGAQFAAVVVMDIIKLTAEATAKMKLLATLAESEGEQ